MRSQLSFEHNQGNFMQDIIQALNGYFREVHSASLKVQDNIFNAGIIDSLGFINLIQFIMETFRISIEADELVEENFHSLERIAEYVVEKRQ
jgi:acyl carrier protein